METSTRDPIIIAGHSHTMAFNAPWGPRPNGGFELVPLSHPQFVGLVGWPRNRHYWDHLIKTSTGRQVGIGWGGNEHMHLFLLGSDPDVDFLLAGEAFGAPDAGAEVVPAKLVETTLRLSFDADLSPILRRLKDAGAEPFLIGSPPPRGDEHHVRKLLHEKDQFFADFSKKIGVDIRTAKLVPVRRRYKAWVLMQRIRQDIADQHGIRFIPAPTGPCDDNGYLRPEYASDVTHGNVEYGKIVLDHIWRELPNDDAGIKSADARPELPETRHPYKVMPNRNFWSRAFSDGVPFDLVKNESQPLIRVGEKVVSAGSCFASNITPHLEGAGFTYLRTEQRHPTFGDAAPEHFGYSAFSAAYGNIYTARQLLQLLRRSRGVFKPIEERWDTGSAIIDPFRPGLKYQALSHEEFDILTQQHLKACLRAFAEADVFIFTLGLTEAWESKQDGAVFPACPGTIPGAGKFDPHKHKFTNFSAWEISSDLRQFVDELRLFNPNVRVVLTVSPVPLVATATDGHVLAASSFSKSVLRVAAETVCRERPNVTYFPAYEIVTGPHALPGSFLDDKRNVSPATIDHVMQIFLSYCEAGEAVSAVKGDDQNEAIRMLSEQFVQAECEELMADRTSQPRSGVS